MKQADDTKTLNLLTTEPPYRAKLAKLGKLLDHLTIIKDNTQQELDELKRQGLKYAKPHFREKKYLYLVHPQKHGERAREYIGADPAKIKDALDAVARANKYTYVSERLAREKSNLERIEYYLDMSISA